MGFDFIFLFSFFIFSESGYTGTFNYRMILHNTFLRHEKAPLFDVALLFEKIDLAFGRLL